MYKYIIQIEKDNIKVAYSSLKKCCDFNPDFSYDYIVRKKMPFNYKGWDFDRLNFNCPIGQMRDGKNI